MDDKSIAVKILLEEKQGNKIQIMVIEITRLAHAEARPKLLRPV